VCVCVIRYFRVEKKMVKGLRKRCEFVATLYALSYAEDFENEAIFTTFRFNTRQYNIYF